MAKHYIGMSGLNGYLPQFITVGPTRTAVAEALASLHERGKNWQASLVRNWYAELRQQDGAEYAEIVECACDTPTDHEE